MLEVGGLLRALDRGVWHVTDPYCLERKVRGGKDAITAERYPRSLGRSLDCVALFDFGPRSQPTSLYDIRTLASFILQIPSHNAHLAIRPYGGESVNQADDGHRLIQEVLSELGWDADPKKISENVRRLDLGLPAEDQFTAICIWLGKARLVHKLDQHQAPLKIPRCLSSARSPRAIRKHRAIAY